MIKNTIFPPTREEVAQYGGIRRAMNALNKHTKHLTRAEYMTIKDMIYAGDKAQATNRLYDILIQKRVI